MTSEQLLAERYIARHGDDAAADLQAHSAEDLKTLLESLSPENSAALLARLSPLRAASCLQALLPESAAAALARMPPPIAAHFLRRLPEGPCRTILGELPQKSAAALGKMLKYPEGTAGRAADPAAVTLFADMAVKDSLALLKAYPGAPLREVFVTDRDHRLVGRVEFHHLLRCRPDETVESAMSPPPTALLAESSLEVYRNHAAWEEHPSLPVTDPHGLLVGVLERHTVKALAGESREAERVRALKTAGKALGELLWVALSGMAQAISHPPEPAKKDPP